MSARARLAAARLVRSSSRSRPVLARAGRLVARRGRAGALARRRALVPRRDGARRARRLVTRRARRRRRAGAGSRRARLARAAAARRRRTDAHARPCADAAAEPAAEPQTEAPAEQPKRALVERGVGGGRGRGGGEIGEDGGGGRQREEGDEGEGETHAGWSGGWLRGCVVREMGGREGANESESVCEDGDGWRETRKRCKREGKRDDSLEVRSCTRSTASATPTARARRGDEAAMREGTNKRRGRARARGPVRTNREWQRRASGTAPIQRREDERR